MVVIVNSLGAAQHAARLVQPRRDLIVDLLLPVRLWGRGGLLQEQQGDADHEGL
jgi:hypothetical protein